MRVRLAGFVLLALLIHAAALGLLSSRWPVAEEAVPPPQTARRTRPPSEVCEPPAPPAAAGEAPDSAEARQLGAETREAVKAELLAELQYTLRNSLANTIPEEQDEAIWARLLPELDRKLDKLIDKFLEDDDLAQGLSQMVLSAQEGMFDQVRVLLGDYDRLVRLCELGASYERQLVMFMADRYRAWMEREVSPEYQARVRAIAEADGCLPVKEAFAEVARLYRDGRLPQVFRDEFTREVKEREVPVVRERILDALRRDGLSPAEARALADRAAARVAQRLVQAVDPGRTAVLAFEDKFPPPKSPARPPVTPADKYPDFCRRALDAARTVVRVRSATLGSYALEAAITRGKPQAQSPKPKSAQALRERLDWISAQLARGRGPLVLSPGGAKLPGANLPFTREVHARYRSSISDTRFLDQKKCSRFLALTQSGQLAGGPASPLVALPQARSGVMPARYVSIPCSSPIEKTDKRNLPATTFGSTAFGTVPWLRKPITIDGDLGDWNDYPPLSFRLFTGTPVPDLTPESVPFWLGWDANGLYFGAKIPNPSDELSDLWNFWEGDGVEFYIDPLNTKPGNRGSRYVQQFWVWAFGRNGNPGAVGGESILTATDIDSINELSPPKLVRATQKLTNAYVIEAFLSKDLFRVPFLSPGALIGFDASICRGRGVYYYWAGDVKIQVSTHPDTWGDLLLCGSDAVVELYPGASTAAEARLASDEEGVTSLLPGEPLTVRVTDRDQNRRYQARERLCVTVRSAVDAEPLILEETGVNSETFEGTIPTNLYAGCDNDGVLEVLHGDVVIAEYIDPVTAKGARYAPTRGYIPCASPLVQFAHQ